jgi:nucleoside-diphosphate-sugar epimerase
MKKRVLITGSSGLIGGLTIQHLGDKYEFSGLSRRPTPGVPHTQADITDAAAIRPAFEGIHTVLHLAAATGADEWLEWAPTMAMTVNGTLNVYEAARQAGVRRVLFMSSGCVQLGWEWDERYPFGTLANGPEDQIPAAWPMVDLSWPVRPDSPYAVGKLFGENLGRYYADKHGISSLVIRLGGVLKEDRPLIRRQFPGFLAQADCVQMIDRCLSAPDDLLYDVFNAISENKLRWRSTDHGKQVLGWQPTGSAEEAAKRA